MKIKQLAAALIAAVLLVGNPLMATSTPNGIEKKAKKAVTYAVDVDQSTLTWNAKKVGGEHTGTVKLAKGELLIDGSKLTGGSFVADMTTIKDTDITNEGMNGRLTGHLKSDDFFSTEKNPTATFKITKVTPIAGAAAGAPNYTVTGDLTIKGTTKPVTFPATVKVSGNNAEATAKVEVNRIDYDIKYRAAIIGTAADKIIDDKFTFDIKLVAGKTNS